MNHIIQKEFVIVTGKTNPFEINLKVKEYLQYKYLVLAGCSIPKSWYGLPSDSKLNVTIDASTYEVKIPACNSNPNTLSTYIKNYLSSNYAITITIAYPDSRFELDTNKFTITHSGSSMTISADNVFLAHMIGLDDEKTPSEQKGATWVSPNPLDYQSHNKLSITTDLLAKKSLKEIVANTTPYNTYIEYICPDLQTHFRHVDAHPTNGLYEFKIIDENNLIVDFNKQTITLSLCFFNASETEEGK